MNFIIKIMWIILSILFFLVAVYFFFLFKIKNLNNKIYKYKEQSDLKEKNVLIIYQPTRRKTTSKIVERIKTQILDKNYGYKIVTLNPIFAEIDQYKYVIFVLPVYFSNVNKHAKSLLEKCKKNKVIIVYNGLNREKCPEDETLRKQIKLKYESIKLHGDDLENVDDFIKREVN